MLILFPGQAAVDYYTGGDGYDPDSEEDGSRTQSDEASESDEHGSESKSPDARCNVTSPSQAPEKQSAPPYMTNEAGTWSLAVSDRFGGSSWSAED